jgi:regulator of protease activity HflC (stomatin/prohibitin superfamily)
MTITEWQAKRCQNRIYTNRWSRQCNRARADEAATLCKVCNAAKIRGEARREAADAARQERWAMDAWRSSVASAERDVVKAAKAYVSEAGISDDVALYDAVRRLQEAENSLPTG